MSTPSPPARLRGPSTLDAAEEAAVARLRALCLALPEAEERPSHGEPTWFVGRGKVFATLDRHHHGAEHLSVWLPLPLGAQETLIAADPRRYFKPPYVGSRGWVAVVLETGPDWKEVARLVRLAYLRVAPRKLAALVDGAPEAGPPARPARRTGRRGRAEPA